jgi:hypothetical protein
METVCLITFVFAPYPSQVTCGVFLHMISKRGMRTDLTWGRTTTLQLSGEKSALDPPARSIPVLQQALQPAKEPRKLTLHLHFAFYSLQ